MSSPPFFTVAIPTYKRPESLARAINGVLSQSFTDLELIIGDNCPTDETRDVVNAVYDPRLRHIQHAENIGALANFHHLAKAAKGRYFVLHQDDDALHRDFLKRCHEQVADKPKVVMYASTWWRGNSSKGFRSELMGNLDGRPEGSHLVDEPSILDGRRMAVSLLFSFYFAHPTIALRTDIVDAIGGYCTQDYCVSDVVTEARVLCHGDLVYDPRPGGIFYDHAGNASRVMSKHVRIRTYNTLYRLLVEDFERQGFDWRTILREQLKECEERHLWKVLRDWVRNAAPFELQSIAWRELRNRHDSTLRLQRKLIRRIGIQNVVRFIRNSCFGSRISAQTPSGRK
jgi:glycosyltransferase involved in cell wall biosynthesis